MAHSVKLCATSKLFEGARKLVGTRRWLDATLYPLETAHDIGHRQSLDKSTDALEISVTAAHECHVMNTSCLVDLKLDGARACPAGSIIVFHNQKKMNVHKTKLQANVK